MDASSINASVDGLIDAVASPCSLLYACAYETEWWPDERANVFDLVGCFEDLRIREYRPLYVGTCQTFLHMATYSSSQDDRDTMSCVKDCSLKS